MFNRIASPIIKKCYIAIFIIVILIVIFGDKIIVDNKNLFLIIFIGPILCISSFPLIITRNSFKKYKLVRDECTQLINKEKFDEALKLLKENESTIIVGSHRHTSYPLILQIKNSCYIDLYNHSKNYESLFIFLNEMPKKISNNHQYDYFVTYLIFGDLDNALISYNKYIMSFDVKKRNYANAIYNHVFNKVQCELDVSYIEKDIIDKYPVY